MYTRIFLLTYWNKHLVIVRLFVNEFDQEISQIPIITAEQ